MARYAVSTLSARWFGNTFPLGTFLVNITGSFLLGLLLTLFAGQMPVSDATRLALAVGFLGAYTTFSTFMYETNSLFANGSALKAILNLAGSLIVGLLAVRLGIMMAR